MCTINNVIEFHNNDIKFKFHYIEHLSVEEQEEEVFCTRFTICTKKPKVTTVGGLYSCLTLTNEVIVMNRDSHFALHF